MLRKTLLATTALVLGASLAFAAHQNGTPSSKTLTRIGVDHASATMLNTKGTHQGVVHNTPHFAPGAIFTNFSKDANAEFVSWYGYTALNSSYHFYVSHSSHETVKESGFNAEPFTGTGKAPKSAVVPGFGYASTYRFDVEILNSAAGLPGASVATTSTFAWPDTSDCCTAATTANFTGAPKLTKGATYFAAVACANAPCEGGWNMENTNFSGSAGPDYWHIKIYETYNFHYGHTYTYSDSSPWHASTGIPATGAIIINK
jgi:hypothetical protein